VKGDNNLAPVGQASRTGEIKRFIGVETSGNKLGVVAPRIRARKYEHRHSFETIEIAGVERAETEVPAPPRRYTRGI